VETIGGHRVLERLGQGGMGVVLRVEDPRTRAPRALKLLSEQADPDARRRFAREAQAMAAVDDHPHVLRIHAAGEDAGRPYIVMDLATGGDLAARLKAGPLPAGEVVRLGRALASGLAHVHARGVLHRDLKPANVLFDERGAPKLVDFGLARLEGAERLTATGTILGTASYMAPEQADGRRDIDARADVYGLAAVLYHALTGQPPFRRGSPIATLNAVLHDPPVRPRELVPDAPPALEAALLRGLAKERRSASRRSRRWPPRSTSSRGRARARR
jgi:eukaryotic-like serine/threonine-protein kinase